MKMEVPKKIQYKHKNQKFKVLNSDVKKYFNHKPN